VPDSSRRGTTRYWRFYLLDIQLKLNFGEISVMELKANNIVTIVKFVDNDSLQLYI
jgi:hypothetical protein